MQRLNRWQYLLLDLFQLSARQDGVPTEFALSRREA